MLFVLADDFSGAAEIGGIGHRYGLSTEIQLNLETESTADLVVLDTDTRSLTEVDAIKKISEISALLTKWNKPIRLFKKIDSVMRGHLIPELNVLQQYFHFNNVLLMPANPNRGRKIIGGKYFVNGTPLNETVFADDPDFPVASADIGVRVRSYNSLLNHVHLTTNDKLPSSSLITGDAEFKNDLKKYVAGTGKHDLCCGAAELFEAYLENHGYSSLTKNLINDKPHHTSFVLIMNGSTVKDPREKEWYDRLNIVQRSLPGRFIGNDFVLPKGEALEWHKKILDTLSSNKMAVVTIDHPIQHNKLTSEKFLNYFVELMKYITEHLSMNSIHFCITGGATASSIVRSLDEGKLYVKEEIAPGVVTLAMESNGVQQGYFTVKPGSYGWPDTLIKRFTT